MQMKVAALLLCLVVSPFAFGQATAHEITNSDVIGMTKAGIGEQTIILAIQRGPVNFDTSPRALVVLKGAGVSDTVLDAILSASNVRPNKAQQPSVERDAGKQHAIEQLRAIAEAIKKCPKSQLPNKYGTTVISAPLNTVWNVVQRETAHSDEIGYIEYAVNAEYISDPLKECKKRDSSCQWDNWEAAQMTSIMLGVHSPDQFRFEFDLGSRGLEFRQSDMKHQTDDETHWVADSLGGCEGDAVLMALNSRPSQIPDEVWEAAKEGEPDALTRLGAIYQTGYRVPKDPAQALHWYRRAADSGYARGESFLGAMYLGGQGVQQDYTQAIFWLRKAAGQSDVMGQFNLGRAYYFGDGVEKNSAEAYFWFSLAAMGSSPKEMVESARNHRDEIGVKLKAAILRESQQRISQWVQDHSAKPQ